MAIQFPCSGCGNQLSVPDSAAGKKARCPKCSTVIAVPASEDAEAGTAGTAGSGFGGVDMGAPEGGDDEYQLRPTEESPSQGAGTFGGLGGGPAESASFPNMGAPQKPSPQSENPYASPTVGYEESFAPTKGRSTVTPTIIDFGDVFSHAWELYLNNLWVVLLTVDLVWLVNMISGYALNIVVAVVTEQSEEAGLILSIVGQIGLWVFNTFLGIGQTLILLDVARGRRFNLERIFGGGPYLLWVILGSVAFAIMVYLGVLLLIVPGIILALMFGQFYFLMIDQEMGFSDAFSTSMQITNGNKWTLLGIYIVAGLIMLAACLALCFPGLFFMPYVALVYVVTYLKLSGQPIARV